MQFVTHLIPNKAPKKKKGYNLYITEVETTSGLYSGLMVYAKTEEDAQQFLSDNGYEYMRVLGVLVAYGGHATCPNTNLSKDFIVNF